MQIFPPDQTQRNIHIQQQLLTCYGHPGVERVIWGGLLVQLRGHRLTRGRVQAAGVPRRRGERSRGAVVAGTRCRVAAYEAPIAADPRALRRARGRAHHRVALTVASRRGRRLPHVLDNCRCHCRCIAVLMGRRRRLLLLLLALLAARRRRVRRGGVTRCLGGCRVELTGGCHARVVRRVLRRSRVGSACRVYAKRRGAVMMMLRRGVRGHTQAKGKSAIGRRCGVVVLTGRAGIVVVAPVEATALLKVRVHYSGYLESLALDTVSREKFIFLFFFGEAFITRASAMLCICTFF